MSEETYKCDWCGFGPFKKEANKISKSVGKHAETSTQIKCPKCTNFIKTWKD